MKPTVTVVIPSYNAGRYLLTALDSVFKQTYREWQLIVVDDASTDHSIDEARSFLKDSRVRVHRNRENLGQSKCLNQGLALTRTPYLLQLDSDDWFSPDTLATMHAAAEKLPDCVALVSGNLKLVIEDAEGNFIKEAVWRNRSFSDRYDFLLADCSQWPRFYRTAALEAVGGWPVDDPYEGRYMEDKRILFRLIEKYRFHWIDKTMYYHRRHSKNQTNLTGIYNELAEWTICDALKRWGGRYKPVFREDAFGRKKLLKLVPVFD